MKDHFEFTNALIDLVQKYTDVDIRKLGALKHLIIEIETLGIPHIKFNGALLPKEDKSE